MDLLQKVAILVLLSVLLVDHGLAQPRVECGRLTGGVASGSAPQLKKAIPMTRLSTHAEQPSKLARTIQTRCSSWAGLVGQQ